MIVLHCFLIHAFWCPMVHQMLNRTVLTARESNRRLLYNEHVATHIASVQHLVNLIYQSIFAYNFVYL